MKLSRILLIKKLNLQSSVFNTLVKNGLKKDSKNKYDLQKAKEIIATLNLPDEMLYKQKEICESNKNEIKTKNRRLIERYRLELEEERLKLLNIKLRKDDKKWELANVSDLDLANEVNTTITFLQNTLKSLPLDICDLSQDDLNERLDVAFNNHIRSKLKNTPLSIDHLSVMSKIYDEILKKKEIKVLLKNLNLLVSKQ
jgi:hypothetical protein